VALSARGQAEEDAQTGNFDAVLAIPSSPSDLGARLSVVLYSHRALAQRYQSALEELSLNRNIFRSVSNGISVSNAQLPDMPLMYVNPSFELMTGYSLDEVEGRNCRFLQQEDRDQPGLTLVREALVQRRQTTAVLRNYRKDGTCFWNELTLSPIFNRDGVLTHFVGIQMDVSERVNMESALRESEKLAAVGRLASSISHEINNPLEAVMNLVYLTRQLVPENDETREGLGFLRQADEELQRVKLIAAQSLRFYKQSSGPEALLCSALVKSVMDLYGSRLANYGVTAKLRERSTQHIVGLASELRQVVSNLVSNAVDAMKSHGGTLYLRTREATWWPDDKKGVLLTVADTGMGMSEETQRKLFKAFYTTKGASGTGLGLWISQGIIARHHGHMKVRSSMREGHSYTVFTLFLPYQGASGTAPSSGLSDAETAASQGQVRAE
jgi:two-component system, sporulation sensor kinase C